MKKKRKKKKVVVAPEREHFCPKCGVNVYNQQLHDAYDHPKKR